ncbi:hypothetical protein SELMODRAFT_5698, partial [Selaginella moellendorffii]
MPERDVVAWTVMLLGFAESGRAEEAIWLFACAPERNPDMWTALAAMHCRSGDAREAERVMAAVDGGIPARSVVSWTVMVEAYAQAGHIGLAAQLFSRMPERDTVSWNVMVVAYAHCARVNASVHCLHMMHVLGLQPNGSSLLSVLCACNHIGTVSSASQSMVSMMLDHGITPQPHHISCLVDILGRAGQLRNAQEL